MSRQFMMVGVVLGLLVMVFFISWPVWKWIQFKHVSAALYDRTKLAVDRNPSLKPAWNIAMQDGVLTQEEAKEILESAGEKVEP